MKRLFLLLVAVCVAAAAGAQVPVKYQGEVDLGCSLGVGALSSERINIHTIQGVKVGEYFSTGVGIGADYYISGKDMTIPLFLNLKGYIPTNSIVTPYASLDLGTGIGVAGIFKGGTGLLLNPAVGVKIGMCKVQLGYNLQQLTESGVSLNFNAVQVKLGVVF